MAQGKGATNMLFALIAVLVLWMHTFIKTHQITHFKC